jgi:SAM-dependent methyltransferase
MRQVKGWFATPGRPGDRTLSDQLKGLELIDWRDRTVLDLGCAEGLIGLHALASGAKDVLGVEIVPEHVAVARRVLVDPRATVITADLNTWPADYMVDDYDIVLMLAVLHKLRKPLERLAKFAAHCRGQAVLRLPPSTGPVICDARSGMVRYDTRPVMERAGFRLEAEGNIGHLGEYMAFWRRVRA